MKTDPCGDIRSPILSLSISVTDGSVAENVETRLTSDQEDEQFMEAQKNSPKNCENIPAPSTADVRRLLEYFPPCPSPSLSSVAFVTVTRCQQLEILTPSKNVC